MFVFYAGVLESDAIARIKLAPNELSAFDFVAPQDAFVRLGPVLGARILRAHAALQKGSTSYFDGSY